MRCVTCLSRCALLCGSLVLASGSQALGQHWFQKHRSDCCPPVICQPCPSVQLAPPEALPNKDAPPVPPPEQPPLIEPTFAPEQAAAGGDYYAAAPNMVGDLFNSTVAISFPYANALLPGNVELASFANLINAKVAENNSPLPMDRLAFRYNYFHNASQVTGPTQLVQDTMLGLFYASSTTRQIDTHAFSFAIEKTFFDDLCSVELRIPFFNTLSSDQQLSDGQILVADPQVFIATPDQTLGDTGSEFGDLAIVLKGLLYYTSQTALAAGLGITIPTGSDNRVQVVDVFSFQPGAGPFDASRTRDLRIDNDSWSLSPYVAGLLRPSDRLWLQGFLQLYFPVGDNQVAYSDSFQFLNGQPIGTLNSTTELEGQTTLFADLGIGYWLLHNANGQGLTGLAPLAELHYTTALEDADIVTLTGDPIRGPTGAPQSAPQIGNFRNRFDYLNATIGGVAEFGNRLLIATGVVLPLRDGDDRFFDWELQVQINYRFGPAPSYLAPPPL